jgi:hypothetical protein
MLSAIGMAGASHAVQFPPSLRDSFNSIPLAVLTNFERTRLRMTVHVLSMLDDLQAASALPDFWRQNEQRIPKDELHLQKARAAVMKVLSRVAVGTITQADLFSCASP